MLVAHDPSFCWRQEGSASRALEKQEDDGACRPHGAARLAKLIFLIVIFMCGFQGRVLLNYIQELENRVRGAESVG
jgi:hypothetical protein